MACSIAGFLIPAIASARCSTIIIAIIRAGGSKPRFDASSGTQSPQRSWQLQKVRTVRVVRQRVCQEAASRGAKSRSLRQREEPLVAKRAGRICQIKSDANQRDRVYVHVRMMRCQIGDGCASHARKDRSSREQQPRDFQIAGLLELLSLAAHFFPRMANFLFEFFPCAFFMIRPFLLRLRFDGAPLFALISRISS